MCKAVRLVLTLLPFTVAPAAHAQSTPTFPVLVNFQDPATTPPAGYFRDYGQAYGTRSAAQGGIAYGWVVPGTTTPLDLSVGGTIPGNGRNRGTPADVRLATFMHMQAGGISGFNGTAQNGSWEIAVPTGTYQVTVSVGDASFYDSVHGLSVEGVPAVSGFAPSGSAPFRSATVGASVSDGRLTLAATGSNTKVNFVEIRTTAAPPPPPPAPVCGNGAVESPEQCDDGNTSSGDGCSATCTIESPSTETKLALTRLADSSGWTNIAAATDGNTGTAADKATSTGTEWISYGFGGSFTLTRARLNEDNQGNWRVDTWQVQGWNGSAWVDLTPFTDTPTGAWNEVALNSFVTDRVRVNVRHSSHVEVREIEVYGRAGTSPPPPPPPPPPPSGVIARINAGGAAFTDSQGRAWDADRAFNTGSAASHPYPGADPQLYGTERWDPAGAPELRYSIPVAAGSYDVRLHFAEIYSGAAAVGARVFDVAIEGAVVVAAVDVFKEVGFQKPLVRTFTVSVSDGSLTIDLLHRIENPKLSGIEVLTAGSPPPPPPPGQVCGNGTLEAPEECDDGNTTSGDGCSASCAIEASGPCVPSPSQFPGQTLSPLHCAFVKVNAPYLLDFSGEPGTVVDGSGVGSGLTMVLPKPAGTSYDASKLRVDTAAGEIAITTTAGIPQAAANNLDNGLGIGLALPNASLRVAATLVNPPAGSGAFEQAGLYLGLSQQDYVKLVLISMPDGRTLVQALMEQADAPGAPIEQAVTMPVDRLRLAIEARPAARTLDLLYEVGQGGAEQLLARFTGVPASWFNADGAGIDFNVGTRTFAGLLATHRNRTLGPLVYRFREFALTTVSDGPPPPPPPPSGSVDFTRWSVPIANPTAIAHGPDGRLYVASASGTLHALTLDSDTRTVRSSTTITSVQNRLVLGLAVDPASTPGDVILWVSHSNLSQTSGQANAGTVSRLAGAGHATRQDVIVGLPRAKANHSVNHIHFGPDGRLFIAQGGNTGAGAANDGGSEFGMRPEQPLSAGLLVADVKSPAFNGNCTPTQDPAQMDATGIATKEVRCDVLIYASGLRNPYDFVFHSNGELYGTDNGLGVEGTFPDLKPSALSWTESSGCEGPVLGATARAAHDPGTRFDVLQRIEQGGFFGHPNPSRNECVFFGGNPTSGADGPVPNESGGTDYQESTKYPTGRAPQSGFRPAMFSFGLSKSADGIVEYTSNAFCGAMKGDLLVTYYSSNDQVRRLTLSGDGRSVAANSTLVRTTTATGGTALADPLPIAQDPLGRLYVGEFGGGRVAIFEPKAAGCWQTQGVPALPAAVLDAGGAVLNGELYVVGGKTAAGPQRTVYAYSPLTNAWRSLPPLPAAYPAVENPTVIAFGGALYVAGGSTAPFSGAVANAARFDPATQTWSMLVSMPAARGGAVGEAVNGKLYVAGGMDAAGSSRRELFVYDPATNTWAAAPPMATPRDNAMSASVGGKLYVFGGRTRLAAPFPDNGTLASAEVFDPLTGAWAAITPLPTGRRAGDAAVVNGRVLVVGGEGAGTFSQTELYDPATDSWQSLEPMPLARHGVVAGRIGNGIFVVGGGAVEGTSFTADVDVFRYE